MAFAAADEPSGTDPNCMLLPPLGFPATGPPFGMYPDAPVALMTTDGFRVCSPTPEVELVGVLPLTVVGVPTVGTAGEIALPFIDELTSGLPCCGPLAAAAADGVELPDTEGGGIVFFVALA